MNTPEPSDFDDLFEVNLPDSPYPGLRPFQKHEWPVFFGRERMIDDVISRLLEARFVAVHGDSGSGKSSLICAGVLPHLEQYHGRNRALWQTAIMQPLDAPMRNLARAFAQFEAVEPDERLSTEYHRILNLGGDAALKIAERLTRTDGEYYCVLVDQFEELFAFDRRHGGLEAALFVDVLAGFQRHMPKGIHIILTMRSEFLGACARYTGLAETINATQYLLPPMNRRALLRAIEEPALLYNGEVSLELAERLIADAGSGQDHLPLIQHGLMLLYRRKTATPESDPDNLAKWRLSLADYREVRNVADLLSSHADSVADDIARTHVDGSNVLEWVFRALTDIDAEGHAVRNPQKLVHLARVADTDIPALKMILAPLRVDGVSFIRPYGDTPLADDDLIDISHEALIRCWKRISAPDQAGWLHREFEDGLIWKSLLVQAEGFENHPDQVLSPATTQEREQWLKDRTVAWSDRYGGGWDKVDELMKASRRDMDRQKVTKFMLGLVTLFLIVTGVGLLTYKFQSDENAALAKALAEERDKVAEEKRAVELALNKYEQAEQARIAAEQEVDKLKSKLLAKKSLEAARSGDTSAGLSMALPLFENRKTLPYIPAAEMAAYEALYSHYPSRVLSEPGSRFSTHYAQFSPDGSRILTADFDVVRIWSADTGDLLSTLRAHEREIYTAELSSNGSKVLTASADGTVHLWDAESGESLSILLNYGEEVFSARFSPDHKHILTVSRSKETTRASILDVASGEEVVSLSVDTVLVADAQYSPDGKRILIVSANGAAGVWNAENGNRVVTLGKDAGTAIAARYSPDGARIVTTYLDGSVRIWNADNGALLETLSGHTDAVIDAQYSPDGSRIVTASLDNTARIWSAENGQLVATLAGHTDEITSLQYSPDGSHIVTASLDESARIWNADNGELTGTLGGNEGAVHRAQYSPDGTRVVTLSRDAPARIWQLHTVLYPTISKIPSRILAEQNLRIEQAAQSVYSRRPRGQLTEEYLDTRYLQTQRSAVQETSLSAIGFDTTGHTLAWISGSTESYAFTWQPSVAQAQVRLENTLKAHPLGLGFDGARAVLPFEKRDAASTQYGFYTGEELHSPDILALTQPSAWAVSPEGVMLAALSTKRRWVDVFEVSADSSDDKNTVRRKFQLLFDSSTDEDFKGDWSIAFDKKGEALTGVGSNGRYFHMRLKDFDTLLPASEHGPRIVTLKLQSFRVDAPPVQRILAINDTDVIAVVEYPTRSPDSQEGQLAIFDLIHQDDVVLWRPDNQRGMPRHAAFSYDGSRAALIFDGSDVQIFSGRGRASIASLKISGKRFTAGTFAPDGRSVAAVTENGEAVVWPIFMNTRELKAAVREAVPQPLSEEELNEILESDSAGHREKSRHGGVTQSRFKVFVQFAGVLQREEIITMAKELSENGWQVQGAERGGERTARADGVNEIRYSSPDARIAAEMLAADVNRFSLSSSNVSVNRVTAEEFVIPDTTLEVWISQ